MQIYAVIVVFGVLFGIVGLRDYRRARMQGHLEKQSEIEAARIEKSVETYRKTIPPGAVHRSALAEDLWDTTPPPRVMRK